MRVAPAGHDEALHTTTLADDKPAVRRERRPAFADKILVRAFCSGNKSREAFLKTVEHLPIGLDRRRFAAQRKTARVQVQRSWFPAAQQQSTVAHAAVEGHFRNAEARQLGRKAVHRVERR